MAPYIPLLILFIIGAVITVTFFTATTSSGPRTRPPRR